MTADLDRDVPPLGIEQVEGKVVDIRIWLLAADVPAWEDIPDGSLCSAFQDEEQSFLHRGGLAIYLCQFMLGLLTLTPYEWNLVCFRPSA